MRQGLAASTGHGPVPPSLRSPPGGLATSSMRLVLRCQASGVAGVTRKDSSPAPAVYQLCQRSEPYSVDAQLAVKRSELLSSLLSSIAGSGISGGAEYPEPR